MRHFSKNARIVEAAVLIAAFALTAGARNAPTSQEPAPTPAAQPQTEEEGDRFPQARKAADEARNAYEKVDMQNIQEAERLLKTRRCQIDRVSGLLDRTSESLDSWLSAEKVYWTSWNDAETKRVEGQQKSLTSLEADRQRAADLVEADKQDREERMHRKALLEKSAQTGQVKAEIEGLNRDIRDSEARLSEAQKQFDDITASLDNLKASLTAPLVNIRQNLAQLDTYRLEQHSAYEDKRKTAEEICNTRQAAPATSAAQPQAEEETDRFPQARKDADEARNAYEKVDMENIREAERLLKTRRCQIARVSGLLDRTSEFLDSWLSAEKVYWTSWNEAETKRVEGQKKYLTSRESDRQLAAHLVEVHKQDREELIHRKALLEKSAQTGQIKAEIDALNRDTQDNEARLSKAQKQFEDITSSLKNSEASLRARRMIIRQNLAQLDTYRLKQHAAYEGKRKTAEDICTTHSD